MLAVILLKQLIVMAIQTALGLVLCKLGLLTETGTRELGGVLVKAVIPCVIFRAFVSVPYTMEVARSLLIAFGFSFLLYVFVLGVAYLIYGTRDRMSNLGASFGNAGFMGVPLVQAVAGETGVFYLATLMALLNLFQWTYGINLMIGKKASVSLKSLFFNPMMISLLLGMLFFFMRIPVPEMVMTSLNSIAGVFTPMAMLLVGSYMAKISAKDMLDLRAVLCSLVRLVLIPVITIFVTMLLPKSYRSVYMPILLASFTPIGVNISIYAQQYDQDYAYSVVLICVSTILSIVTVPLVYSLADRLI